MLRTLHALPGLLLALMLAITAGTGAILAGNAALDAASAPEGTTAMSVAELAQRVAGQVSGVEKITRTPSGRIRVTHLVDGRPRAVFVDLWSGAPVEADVVPPAFRTITNLHRAWLSGDGGRLAAGLSAFAMLVLGASGLLLLRRTFGGWGSLLRPFRGAGSRRWHAELGRIAVAGLLLSSATGLHMSLVGFELLPDGSPDYVMMSGSGGSPRPLGLLEGLTALPVAELREVALPDPADPTDPIRVVTGDATRFVDTATGLVLREDLHSTAWHIRDIAYRLHTAEGMLGLALLLALCSASAVVLSLTGLVIGLRRRFAPGGVRGNAPADTAEILLLVGSDGGSTLSFARSLHQDIAAAGRRVHVAPMNEAPDHSPASHLIILTATAGDGEAPASASRFIDRLARWQGPRPLVTIVGFGDRQFPRFCGYADQVEAACRALGFTLALPTERIDRQSTEAFARWTEQLASCLGHHLILRAAGQSPAGQRFRLLDREDFGAEVQAPTAILRFRMLPRFRWLPRRLQQVLGLMPSFAPGDLVAISPPSDLRPRFYSIASHSRGGILEICVRRQPGGACSGYLCDLSAGDEIAAAIRPNPSFKPAAGARPLILIGAGAGIAPLVGFVRHIRPGRPVHLYFGARDPGSDFLFRRDLEAAQGAGRLTRLRTIFSRIPGGGYVQDLVAQDAADLGAAIAAGGQVLICGGREMAEGVRGALEAVVAPLGLDLAALRQTGRLLEDVY